MWVYTRDAQPAARGSDPAPEGVLSGPRSRLKYKKYLLHDGDFRNEFKLHWTIKNFATSYNPKQLWWQQYQSTSNSKTSKIQCFLYATLETSENDLVFALECTRNNTLRPLAQKGCVPLVYTIQRVHTYQRLFLVGYSVREIIPSSDDRCCIFSIPSD